MENPQWKKFVQLEQASRDTIDFKKIYVDLAGDIVSGLLLSQIIYWNLPDKDGKSKLRVVKKGEYWLAKRASDWWEEVRLTPRQATYAIKKLVKKGLVRTKVFKFNGEPTTHIQLLVENFVTNYITQTGQLYHTFEGELTNLSKPNDNFVISSNRDQPTEITKIHNGFSVCPSDTTKTNPTYKENETGKTVKVNTGSKQELIIKVNKIYAPQDLAQRLLEGGIDPKNVEEEKIFAISYYFKVYRDIEGKEHPNLKKSQMLRVIDQLYPDLGEGFEQEIYENEWETMIDHHFSCASMQTDYNINHFASPKLLKTRYYQCVYVACPTCEPSLHATSAV